MLVAISGGAGFLGLHLARRLAGDGCDVRTLDLVPLDDRALEGTVDELRGDVRVNADARRLVAGAEILVHAAAALPIQVSRSAIRSVNVEGAAVTLAAALEAGIRRVVLVSSTAVYGVPERHPIHEDDPLVGVGHYGASKIEAERLSEDFARRGLEVVILRPKTFVGPERLGVFEILFDWIREGRRIPILGDGENRYQLLAVEDLVEAVVRCFDAAVAGEALNIGASRFGTVREDLEALARHAGSGSQLYPVPAGPAELALRGLELARLSPLAEWHYRTAHKDSYVSIDKARAVLGWEPRLSNAETLCATYDWYLAHLGRARMPGRPIVSRGISRARAPQAAQLTCPRRDNLTEDGVRTPISVERDLCRFRAHRSTVSTLLGVRELLDYRAEFPILEHTTYLINHSLGGDAGRRRRSGSPSTRACGRSAGSASWGEGWWDTPLTVGDQVGRIIGAPAGSTVMHQNVTVAEAIVLSCFLPIERAAEPDRLRARELPVGALPVPGAAAGAEVVVCRGRRRDRRCDRRADAARADQPRPLQDRRDPGRRADRPPCPRGRART